MIKNLFISATLIFSNIVTQINAAETPSSSLASSSEASSSRAGSWLSYLNIWSHLYNWIASWIDNRTAEQQQTDTNTNNVQFNQRIDEIDALITHAEEEHVKALENIKNNSDLEKTKGKLQKYVASLETARKNLALLQARLSPNYVKEAAEGMIRNFERIKGFNPLDVYTYLAEKFTEQGIKIPELPIASSSESPKKYSFTQAEKAKRQLVVERGNSIKTNFSAEQIYNPVNKLISDQETLALKNPDAPKNPETEKLRQILYLFQTPAAKEQFDAFLKGANPDGLFSLKIEDLAGEKMKSVQSLNERLLIKAELEQDIKTIDEKLKRQMPKKQ